MSRLDDQVVEIFRGGDPIAGKEALQELLARGDAGEELLFSRPIEFPTTMQGRRRWLRYVASREKTIVSRLIDRMQNQDQFDDAYAAAFLFGGIRKNHQAIQTLMAQIDSSFQQDLPTKATLINHHGVANRFMAWGYAGAPASTLWHYSSNSSYAWNKLAVSAFRAGCAAIARIDTGSMWAIEQLITHGGPEVKISDSPNDLVPQSAISNSELDFQANDIFMTWRRGEVADEILRKWSRHTNWRVRNFSANVLASLGFQRTVNSLIEWLHWEPLASVRNSLLHALERTESVSGTDALVAHFNSSSQEGELFLAKSAWRASDGNSALTALMAVADNNNIAGAQAVVSLARLGHRHAKLSEMLYSHDSYHRLNAALAYGYLGEREIRDRLVAMKDEAATPAERIFLATAVAMLEKPNGATELNEELIRAANEPGFEKRVDIFFLHKYLQEAVLKGLATGEGQSGGYLDAWRAELEPLDPIPQPIEASVLKPAASLGHHTLTEISSAEKPELHETIASPLRAFVSYSHKDQRMLAKLIEHLTPLVNDGLIQIWQDRDIEAGGDWEGEINREIAEADVILLLVSASFLKSQYCQKELLRAVEQRSVGKSLPIPIILRPCDWTSTFNRRDYKTQALPRDDRPVASGLWVNQDTAFTVIVKELRLVFERMRGYVPEA